MSSAHARRTGRRRGRSGSRRHLPILLTVLLVVVVVAAFVAMRWYSTPVAVPAETDQPQATSVLSALSSIPASELETVGRGTAATDLRSVSAAPLIGPSGKPQVLYVGAEYCPYCAAERWPLAVALSRFGTLSGAGLTTSPSTDVFPGTPTLTFRGSTYSSPYLDLAALEVADREGKPLDQLSAAQQALLQRYDALPYTTSAGGIPFLDVGNRYVSSGASYSPQVLHGMDHQQVARALQDPGSAQARAILGSANMLTAAICQATGQTPASVCGSPAIQAIGGSLGRSS